MKTMKCRDLGGECDEQLTANTSKEMVEKMTAHVIGEHPHTAARMEEMHKKDPNRWGDEFKKKWAETPAIRLS